MYFDSRLCNLLKLSNVKFSHLESGTDKTVHTYTIFVTIKYVNARDSRKAAVGI